MVVFNIILTFLFTIFLVSCDSKKDQEVKREPLQDAYEMIDRNDPSSAIAYLEKLQEKDKRPQVKVALASAYAARGGIKVESYWGFAVGFKAPVLNIEKIESTPEMNRIRKVLNQLDGQLDTAQMNTLGGLTKALATLEIYKDRIDSIPTIEEQKREDVFHALDVLKDVSTRGAQLYRSILMLIVIKTQITEGFKEWNKIEIKFNQAALIQTQKIDQNLICSINLEGYRQWLNSIAGNLVSLAHDMGEAFPSRKEEYQKSAIGIQKAVEITATSWGQQCP